MMYDYIYEESLKRAKHKIWIMSDLQQGNPDNAKECMDISMADFEQLGSPADMIWYLGDSVEGKTFDHLVKMCAMQEEAFSKTGLPLCYALGNHDLDYMKAESQIGKAPCIPFYEMVKNHKGWYTTASYTDPYFKLPLGDFTVYFFSDHVAEDKEWWTTHGVIHGNKEAYPYHDMFEKIREEMHAEAGPVITVSHYAYLGGNRESQLQSEVLPLPDNVKIHFYGHAHIGDFFWAKKDAYRRISWVDWHDIAQINVSSFEHIRGKKCRSVFLHIYEDHSMGIFFRNHDDREFSEVYFPAKNNYEQKFSR